MKLLLWLVPLCGLALANGNEKPIVASMSWTPENGFQLMKNELAEGPNVVAKANFTNAINETGWSYLEIVTMPQFPDKVQVSRVVGGRTFVSKSFIIFWRIQSVGKYGGLGLRGSFITLSKQRGGPLQLYFCNQITVVQKI